MSIPIYVDWEIAVKHTYDENEAKALIGNFLKATMKERGATYPMLAKKLRRWGWSGDPGALANRLSRGGFSAGFFVIALSALGVESVTLDDLERIGQNGEKRALDLRYGRRRKNKSGNQAK